MHSNKCLVEHVSWDSKRLSQLTCNISALKPTIRLMRIIKRIVGFIIFQLSLNWKSRFLNKGHDTITIVFIYPHTLEA